MREDRQHRAIYPTELGYPIKRIHQSDKEHPLGTERRSPAGVIHQPVAQKETG